ncbi:GNAT family N-acetyltransferase [Metabacillus litoralis]|uniref:GNAT family N-acetyltransferase n=1 Tax=Metabacillus litoralis TaxID=152268 RepID=UPI001CFF431E|nr:GNAT family protein [Metabacillus litoralis]
MRPYEKQDAESVFKVVRLKEIAETTISIPHPYPRETADWWINFVRENMKKCSAYEFGLFSKNSPNEYVGNCGFVSISSQHNNGELGYFINPYYWNQGYSTEACSKLVEFGFSTLGLERIYGRCMEKNIASKLVMEKCGLKVEGIAKHEVLKWDKYEDVIHLGLVRSEWNNL